jgi:hypothetical protein
MKKGCHTHIGFVAHLFPQQQVFSSPRFHILKCLQLRLTKDNKNCSKDSFEYEWNVETDGLNLFEFTLHSNSLPLIFI